MPIKDSERCDHFDHSEKMRATETTATGTRLRNIWIESEHLTLRNFIGSQETMICPFNAAPTRCDNISEFFRGIKTCFDMKVCYC
jgi:hypothetical protein